MNEMGQTSCAYDAVSRSGNLLVQLLCFLAFLVNIPPSDAMLLWFVTKFLELRIESLESNCKITRFYNKLKFTI